MPLQDLKILLLCKKEGRRRKEEMMAIAAKVIGAVRLGLVDIRVVIEELDTEEMQRDQEIHMQLHEALINSNVPCRHPKFVAEKTKPRGMSPVRIRAPHFHTCPPCICKGKERIVAGGGGNWGKRGRGGGGEGGFQIERDGDVPVESTMLPLLPRYMLCVGRLHSTK